MLTKTAQKISNFEEVRKCPIGGRMLYIFRDFLCIFEVSIKMLVIWLQHSKHVENSVYFFWHLESICWPTGCYVHCCGHDSLVWVFVWWLNDFPSFVLGCNKIYRMDEKCYDSTRHQDRLCTRKDNENSLLHYSIGCPKYKERKESICTSVNTYL